MLANCAIYSTVKLKYLFEITLWQLSSSDLVSTIFLILLTHIFVKWTASQTLTIISLLFAEAYKLAMHVDAGFERRTFVLHDTLARRTINNSSSTPYLSTLALTDISSLCVRRVLHLTIVYTIFSHPLE